MDFDAFITKYYPDANDVKQKDVLRFLKNAVNVVASCVILSCCVSICFNCVAV